MFIFFLLFLLFYGTYYYLSYQVILLNDLEQIFSQTASKAQEDLKEYSDLVLEDLGKCYVNVLLIILAATLFTFIWILLLKYNANLIIWVSLFALPIILSVGLYYSVLTYINLRAAHNPHILDDPDRSSIEANTDEAYSDDLLPSDQTLAFDKALQTILTAELMSYVHNETLWLTLSIILFVILTLLFIILHSLRDRVKLSIVLIKQASKAINGIKSTLLFPIIPRTLGIAVLIFGVLISLLIISASHPSYRIVGGPHNGRSCHPKLFNKTHSTASTIQQRPRRVDNRTSSSSLPSSPSLTSSSSSSSQSLSFSPPSSSANSISQTQSHAIAPATSLSLVPKLNSVSQQAQKPSTSRVIFDSSRSLANSNFDRTPMSVSRQVTNQADASISSRLVGGNGAGTVLAEERPQCLLNQPLSRQHVWKYHALNIFATLWLIHFISGINQTTLAGAFASYYWAFRKPRDVPFFAVTGSLFRVLTSHLGDIAFGSFLLATIRYIRLVIEFIDNRIRKKGSSDQIAPRSAACFFRVFFWLLDRFLRYIDRNAYIMMSMYGEGYLQSAKRAVELLYKNSTRALVLDYITYFVLLVSRILITGFAGYLTAHETITANLHYKWLPIVLVVLGTYFISKGLFSVYSMAVDTLFICFLIDSRSNDGSVERPYFMSKELRRAFLHSVANKSGQSSSR